MMRTLIILGIFLLTGCASAPETPESFLVSAEKDQVDNSIDESLVWAQRRAVARIRSRITGEYPKPDQTESGENLEKVVEHEYVMQTKEDHPKVQKWIKYYSVKDRERFQRFLNRGAKYKQVIQDLLVTNGLPPDLYYLGILESGYITEAVSHAGAVGPWQFMGPTGREYGLKINNYVDERQDPIRSTMAAIRYLKELYRQKKSWYLALAAYNAGPGRVRRAMRRGGVRNYWTLTKRRLLPYDTREYIPQFLAILTIGKNLEKYDFVEKPEEYLQPMELVKVPSPVKFKVIANATGLSLKTLEELNPHLFKKMTPPDKRKYYHLWVPKEHVASIDSAYAQLKVHRIKGLKLHRRYLAGSRSSRIHRVRRGQNLSSIARRYGTSVGKIKRLNGLSSNRILVGQRLKVKGRVRSSNRYKKFHRVRRGENLTLIAKKYGTSVSKLKKMNGMRSGKIFVGQKLALMPGGAAKAKVRRYKIRRGDNLYKIAKKFGLTIRKLKSLNNLRGNRIMRGQYLTVAVN